MPYTHTQWHRIHAAATLRWTMNYTWCSRRTNYVRVRTRGSLRQWQSQKDLSHDFNWVPRQNAGAKSVSPNTHPFIPLLLASPNLLSRTCIFCSFLPHFLHAIISPEENTTRICAGGWRCHLFRSIFKYIYRMKRATCISLDILFIFFLRNKYFPCRGFLSCLESGWRMTKKRYFYLKKKTNSP